MPSWLAEAFGHCRAEIAALIAAPRGGDGEAAIARAETIITICKERTPSSSWPIVAVRK